MRERLHPLDASFLYLEDAAGPAHVASLGVLEGPVGYEELCRLVERRLTLAPRYRQRIKPVPGGLAQPVWADDASFDVTYHVRRSELPRPGSPEQLHELVAWICARQLDRRRPLWEMCLIDGLADGRTALLTKTHGAMLDGVAPDLTQVIYDNGPRPRRVKAEQWRPHPEPPDVTLVADALGELARRPSQLVGALGRTLLDASKALSTVAGAATEMLEAGRTAARPAPPSPLNHEIGEQRRYSTVSTCLDDYRRVRKAYDVSVTDVVLATVAGALRGWLMMRGELVTRSSVLRAMAPLSVREGLDQDAVGAGAVRVSPVLVDLPVGEPNPTVRLHQISYALHAPRQA
ncbi:MAG: wax ester/triacylglycerol synthase family O-acyltransferase, partial [Dehalococcoidia bacterium]